MAVGSIVQSRDDHMHIFHVLLSPVLAVEVIKTVLSICVCVSVFLIVSTLTAEPFEVCSLNLVPGLTLMISWTSSKFKVKGQGHQVKNAIS